MEDARKIRRFLCGLGVLFIGVASVFLIAPEMAEHAFTGVLRWVFILLGLIVLAIVCLKGVTDPNNGKH